VFIIAYVIVRVFVVSPEFRAVVFRAFVCMLVRVKFAIADALGLAALIIMLTFVSFSGLNAVVV
jgi:hypothetical protein